MKLEIGTFCELLSLARAALKDSPDDLVRHISTIHLTLESLISVLRSFEAHICWLERPPEPAPVAFPPEPTYTMPDAWIIRSFNMKMDYDGMINSRLYSSRDVAEKDAARIKLNGHHCDVLRLVTGKPSP